MYEVFVLNTFVKVTNRLNLVVSSNIYLNKSSYIFSIAIQRPLKLVSNNSIPL